MKGWWRRLRTVEFRHEVFVAAPPEDVDAGPLIEDAAADARRGPESYVQAMARYESRRLKWLLRKPVLVARIRLAPGNFYVRSPIRLDNAHFEGSLGLTDSTGVV
jgi:hypothetical protein